MDKDIKEKNTEDLIQVDDEINLRGVKCPINFVRTKLKLELMENGQVLKVILDDGDPMRNVPRSVKEEGHKIIKVEKIELWYEIYIKVNNV